MDSSTNQVAEFWDWFSRHAGQIRAAGPEAVATHAVTQELGSRLKRCHPGLTWEITPIDPRQWVLCVSADGNPEAFPAGSLNQEEAVTIGADDGTEDILATMTRHRVRRLPVIDGTSLVGTIAVADVARSLPNATTGELVEALSAD